MNVLKRLIVTPHRLYFESNSFLFTLVICHMFSKFICQQSRDIVRADHNQLHRMIKQKELNIYRVYYLFCICLVLTETFLKQVQGITIPVTVSSK